MLPEYLECFSNSGPVKVTVHFCAQSDKHRSMPDQSMHWSELDRLIDHATGMFFTELRFDTHQCPVKKYEIAPEKNTLTIVVAQTGLP